MGEKMSTSSSNNNDNENLNDDDNSNNNSSGIGSSNEIDETATSSTVNRPEACSDAKNDAADKEHSQDEEHQDQEDQEQDASSKLHQPKAAPIIPLFEMDEFGAVIPEASDASSNCYQYRDFSNVPEKDLENQPNTNSNGGITPPSSRGHTVRVQKFPLKLYAMLARKEFQDVISWMPHGRSWKVLKPNLFESLVMPMFFEYSNYHSFNRLVNAWSFRRITVGIDRGSYYHEVSQTDWFEDTLHLCFQ